MNVSLVEPECCVHGMCGPYIENALQMQLPIAVSITKCLTPRSVSAKRVRRKGSSRTPRARQVHPITVSQSPHLQVSTSQLSFTFGSHRPRPQWQHANPSNQSLFSPPPLFKPDPPSRIPQANLSRPPTLDSVKKCSLTRLPFRTASPRSLKLAPAQPR